MTPTSNIHLDPAKLFGLSQAMQVTNLNQTGDTSSPDLHSKASEVPPADFRDLHSKAGEGEIISRHIQDLHSKVGVGEVIPREIQDFHSKAGEIIPSA